MYFQRPSVLQKIKNKLAVPGSILGGAYSFVACLSHLTIDHASPFEAERGGGGTVGDQRMTITSERELCD